jgi:hypothetical protein
VIRLRFVTDFQIVKELLMHVMHQFYKVSAILDRYRNPSAQAVWPWLVGFFFAVWRLI